MSSSSRWVAAALALLLSACGERIDGFDREAWSKGAGRYTGVNPRLGLVEDARAAGVQPGASRAEVRALLGKPDGAGPGADIWYLGRDDMSVDFRTLRVDYDGSGQVVEVNVRNG